MTDWSRKSVCDLATACKMCEVDSALPVNQRDEFAEIYAFAKQLSTLPNAGGIHNISAVISMACRVCKNTFLRDCSGRQDWRQPCLLVQEQICRQEQMRLAEVAQGQKGAPRFGTESA